MTNYDLNLNLNKIPRELLFLLHLIKENDKNLDVELSYKSFDWSLFLDLVLHHRLFPNIYPKIKNKIHLFPDYVVNELRNWHQTNTFKMLFLAGEMSKLNELLSDEQINVLFLKGPFLSEVLYGDLSNRTSSDIDLLVHLNDLEKAEKLLVQNGFVKDNYIETVLNDWKWRHHHYAFIHPDSQVKVEVHWRLNPGPGKELDFNTLWKNKQELFYMNSAFYYLGNEELFFFLVTHGARHGWSRLRWLEDIHQILKRPINWLKVRKTFQVYNYLPVAGQALILSNQLLGTNIDDPIKFLAFNKRKAQLLAQEGLFYVEQMINLHNEPLPEGVSQYHKNYLLHIKSFHLKILFYLSFLFPYPEDAGVFPLPKNLHFLYFFIRPLTWLWRKQKKVSLRG